MWTLLTRRKSLQMLFVFYRDCCVIYWNHWSVSGKLIPLGLFQCLGLNKLEWGFSMQRSVASQVCISWCRSPWASACKLCGLGTRLWVRFPAGPPPKPSTVHGTWYRWSWQQQTFAQHLICAKHIYCVFWGNILFSPQSNSLKKVIFNLFCRWEEVQSWSISILISEKKAGILDAKTGLMCHCMDTPWKGFGLSRLKFRWNDSIFIKDSPVWVWIHWDDRKGTEIHWCYKKTL